MRIHLLSSAALIWLIQVSVSVDAPCGHLFGVFYMLRWCVWKVVDRGGWWKSFEVLRSGVTFAVIHWPITVCLHFCFRSQGKIVPIMDFEVKQFNEYLRASIGPLKSRLYVKYYKGADINVLKCQLKKNNNNTLRLGLELQNFRMQWSMHRYIALFLNCRKCICFC